MHIIECLHRPYVGIEFHNRSGVWAVWRFRRNVLREIILKWELLICLMKSVCCFFVCDQTGLMFFWRCNLMCDHSWITFQLSEALWICILKLWRFLRGWVVSLRPTGAQPSGALPLNQSPLKDSLHSASQTNNSLWSSHTLPTPRLDYPSSPVWLH